MFLNDKLLVDAKSILVFINSFLFHKNVVKCIGKRDKNAKINVGKRDIYVI